PSLRLLLMTAFAGVRGAVTLAGILTLPLLMPDGSLFPKRDLLIFLAKGVILLSLLSASIALPLLTRNLKFVPQPVVGKEEGLARAAAAEAALRHLARIAQPGEKRGYDANPEAIARVTELYRRRLDYGTSDGDEAMRART